MADYFEIDFLDVESKRSGDAICIRYETNGTTYVHVVDGGFQDTGKKVVDHINEHYGNPVFIDNVVVTHPDGDHAGGLRTVLEEFLVGTLWILKPWDYAVEIIHRFTRYTSVANLQKRLREIYPNIDALEQIALQRGISMGEPFQGESIGAFTVVSPSKTHYLDMIVESERTPESVARAQEDSLGDAMAKLLKQAVNLAKRSWGYEVFSAQETSAENEMSVVQYAYLSNKRILMTGDAGRRSMTIAADYTEARGVTLPGIDRFQVPHHGSRRNVSSEVLDRWLGPIKPQGSATSFTAIVSAAKLDEDHPRKAVVRACIHRGAHIVSTEAGDICSSHNAPKRVGWTAVDPIPYSDDQEED